MINILTVYLFVLLVVDGMALAVKYKGTKAWPMLQLMYIGFVVTAWDGVATAFNGDITWQQAGLGAALYLVALGVRFVVNFGYSHRRME